MTAPTVTGVRKLHDEGAGEEGDGAPDHPGLIQDDRQDRRREPGDRQPDAERGHSRRNRAIASRKSGVWRAWALTRAPSRIPSSKPRPSSSWNSRLVSASAVGEAAA